MNPYDFARIDWKHEPERHKPVWHHRFTSDTQTLYSGSLDVDIIAETPIFIADPHNEGSDRDNRKPAQFMQNQWGNYIIPASSLKGMLRSVVEAIGNGCLTLFDGDYEKNQVRYERLVPPPFHHCQSNTNLCLACRIFGMLNNHNSDSGVFLGKINIGDAVNYEDRAIKYDPMYTAVLVNPKPHHDAFYLEEDKRHIAGRKFYFHHSAEKYPLSADSIVYFGKQPANRYIQPLDYGTEFHFTLDFTNLEKAEFDALILAIILEKEMRHKIGYGKPLGLGTIELRPTRLTLIDYTTRYTQPGPSRGKTIWKGDDIWDKLYEHSTSFQQPNLSSLAMEDLTRIWSWPPDPSVDYYYPSKNDWFSTPASRGKRIRDTRNVPRQS